MLFALKVDNTTGNFKLCLLFYEFSMITNTSKYVEVQLYIEICTDGIAITM